jgi:hypothetical protein
MTSAEAQTAKDAEAQAAKDAEAQAAKDAEAQAAKDAEAQAAKDAGEQAAKDAKEQARREAVIRDTPKRTEILFIPGRRLTPRERIEHILLIEAEKEYLNTGDSSSLDKLRAEIVKSPDEPTEREDRLDRVRVAATILMVVALFAIVAVIVFKATPPPGVTQLVSLASGLAGIGLGWLFGAASTRSKKT